MIFKNIKKVKFNENNKFHLIKFNNDFLVNLWYNKYELFYFRQTADKEITELMRRHKSITYKDAVKLLYQPENKKVKFNENNKFHVINFDNDSIFNIWYSNYDLVYFKENAENEIIELMEKHNSMTYKDAIKLLYQPGNICYDSDNFE